MPEMDVVMRAIEGDPLAQIEIGEYTEHCKRTNRVWRRLLLVAIAVNVASLVFNFVTLDGGWDWFIVGMQVVFLPLVIFCWYAGTEHFKSRRTDGA